MNTTQTYSPVHGGYPGTLPAPADPITLLSDDDLEDEMAEVEANLCCPTPWAAAKVFCGCGGRAADYLDRLKGEAYRRLHEKDGGA